MEGLSHRRTSCCYWVAEAVWSSARPIVAHFAVKQSWPRDSHRRGVNNSTGWNVGLILMLSCECGFFGDTWSILCGKNQKYFHLFVFHYSLKLLCVTFSACYGISESKTKKKKKAAVGTTGSTAPLCRFVSLVGFNVIQRYCISTHHILKIPF